MKTRITLSEKEKSDILFVLGYFMGTKHYDGLSIETKYRINELRMRLIRANTKTH